MTSGTTPQESSHIETPSPLTRWDSPVTQTSPSERRENRAQKKKRTDWDPILSEGLVRKRHTLNERNGQRASSLTIKDFSRGISEGNVVFDMAANVNVYFSFSNLLYNNYLNSVIIATIHPKSSVKSDDRLAAFTTPYEQNFDIFVHQAFQFDAFLSTRHQFVRLIDGPINNTVCQLIKTNERPLPDNQDTAFHKKRGRFRAGTIESFSYLPDWAINKTAFKTAIARFKSDIKNILLDESGKPSTGNTPTNNSLQHFFTLPAEPLQNIYHFERDKQLITTTVTD